MNKLKEEIKICEKQYKEDLSIYPDNSLYVALSKLNITALKLKLSIEFLDSVICLMWNINKELYANLWKQIKP